MSDISKHPFDTEATQAEIDEYMKTTAVPGASAEYLHEWELSHGYRVRDEYRPDVMHEVQKVAEPVKQAPAQPTIKIGDMTFTGTEREIELQLKAYFESHPQQTTQETDQPARDKTTGRFLKQDQQANTTTTSAADRVINDQVAKAIEERTGVSLDEVKQLVEERRGQTFMQSWGQATEAYLQTEEGRVWPGGQENKKRLGKLIEQNTLPDGTPYVDAPDKVEILRACVEYMRDHDMIVPNPELEAWKAREAAAANAQADKAALETAIANAKTPEELDELTGKTARAQARLRQGGGGNFGY